MSAEKNHDLTVFYDGGCPYCRTEIKWYQILDRKKRILWIDISSNKTNLEHYGIDCNKAMSELHVISVDGQKHIGVEAFVKIWSQLPFYRLISLVLKRFPFLITLLNKLYKKFAVWRLKRKIPNGIKME